MGVFDAFRPAWAALPRPARGAVSRACGGRILAWVRDTHTSHVVVATATHVVVVTETGQVRAAREWVDVSAAGWEPLTRTVSITWVDGSRAAQWTFDREGDRFAAILHERVRASVVVDEPVLVDGRELGRAALRRNPQTSVVTRQVVRARGVRSDDPTFTRVANAVLDDLAERAGFEHLATPQDDLSAPRERTQRGAQPTRPIDATD